MKPLLLLPFLCTLAAHPSAASAQPGTGNPEPGTAAHSTSSGQAPRPNIILLMGDDYQK